MEGADRFMFYAVLATLSLILVGLAVALLGG
ncbi:MAG: hypothetical protein A07HB70_02005 [uncultured archaeon A07HB70]|jgi:hypothetical protein|nr:MAG: hypothetical protein A07HB70_02005 [uncultured archaeon A07HB70]